LCSVCQSCSLAVRRAAQQHSGCCMEAVPTWKAREVCRLNLHYSSTASTHHQLPCSYPCSCSPQTAAIQQSMSAALHAVAAPPDPPAHSTIVMLAAIQGGDCMRRYCGTLPLGETAVYTGTWNGQSTTTKHTSDVERTSGAKSRVGMSAESHRCGWKASALPAQGACSRCRSAGSGFILSDRGPGCDVDSR
jgi:hypothetical protein